MKNDGLRLVCYVINLDRSADRLATARELLDRTDLHWERVAAVDGKTMGPPPWPDVDHRGYAANMGRLLSPNEVACNLSHIKTLKQFLASDHQYAVILEDDFWFDSAAEFSRLVERLLVESPHWDVVRLTGIRNCLPVKQLDLGDGYALAAPLLKYTVGCAYMLNRHGAEEVLRCAVPVHINYSHRLDNPWAYKDVKYRVVWPRPVRTNNAYNSTVAHGSRKFMALCRVPALLYRLRSGFQRLIYNLRHGLFLFSRRT